MRKQEGNKVFMSFTTVRIKKLIRYILSYNIHKEKGTVNQYEFLCNTLRTATAKNVTMI